MNTELTMLFASAIFALLHTLPYLAAYLKHWGLSVAVGNRDNTPPLPAWTKRFIRAHRNLVENLVHFTAIVLIAQITGVSNEITALGATLFFYARVMYLFLYTLGITWVRTLVFIVAVMGELMIASQLLHLYYKKSIGNDFKHQCQRFYRLVNHKRNFGINPIPGDFPVTHNRLHVLDIQRFDISHGF